MAAEEHNRLLADGPAGYWSDDRPPTMAQYRGMALLACEALGIDPPKTRLEATIAYARLAIAVDEVKAEAPPAW